MSLQAPSGEAPLSEDEAVAERVTSLALLFMNAHHPMPTATVLAQTYPTLARDSAERAFSRDRARLRSCGISVRSVRLADGTPAYAADEESSFADGGALSARDALFVDMACRPLLGDPSFPYAADLRMALAKLGRCFDDRLGVGGAGLEDDAGRAAAPCLPVLFDCLLSCHACRISYRDARGRESERDVAPLGMFGLRGTTYVVAAAMEGTRLREGEMRTFNASRVRSARELRGICFEVPEDFFVEDYIRLPFQMGPTVCEATFLVPPERERDLRRQVQASGSFSRSEQGLVLAAPAADVDAAAAWAVGEGLRPLSPEGLVSAWRRVLREACHG